MEPEIPPLQLLGAKCILINICYWQWHVTSNYCSLYNLMNEHVPNRWQK